METGGGCGWRVSQPTVNHRSALRHETAYTGCECPPCAKFGRPVDEVDTLRGEDVEIPRAEVDRGLSMRKLLDKIIHQERCRS
jgi:hypothetical protein